MAAALRVMHGMRQREDGEGGGREREEEEWRMRRPVIVHERAQARAPCAPWAENAAACVAAPALPSASAAAAGRRQGGRGAERHPGRRSAACSCGTAIAPAEPVHRAVDLNLHGPAAIAVAA